MSIPAQAPDDSGPDRRKPVVAVVFGGRSSEHAVSCSTAASVLAALDRERYDVVPVGITRDGQWVLVADDPGPLRLTASHTPAVAAPAGAPSGSGSASDPGGSPAGTVALTQAAHPGGGAQVIVLRDGEVPTVLGRVDVVLPVLHGPFGEDGTIQGMLDLIDVRYVGSGVLASAAMMDKAVMKVIFEAAGLQVGPYVVIADKAWQRDPAAERAKVEALGWPVFVKPARAGSSMGISRVERSEDLVAAIEAAREHDPKVVVEAGIVGREIECGVLEGHGTDRPRASELGEATVVSGHAFYDFEAKYIAGSEVSLRCPAEVPPAVADEIRRQALVAFEAAGCEGLARVDFFLTDDDRIVINEINTMPGFTPTSMYPMMWAASGVPYPQLVDELLTLALERRTGLR